MTEIIVPVIGADGAFTGDGLDAAMRVHYGLTINICSPDFGADFTGVEDCTPIFQKAVDFLNALGGGVIEVPAGDFRFKPDFVQMKGYIVIRGQGRFATRLWIDNSTVDSSTVETGLFHTGTYGQRVTDRSLFRSSISDLSIQVTNRDGSLTRTDKRNPFQHIPGEAFNDKVWGICYNTYLAPGPAEPDSVHYFNNIEIWNTAGGVSLLGLDDQGCQVSNIRIRKTWKQGLLVGKPGDHPEAYEENPADSTKPYRRAGAADNHFFNIDVSSANMGLGGWAAFEVNTSQCYFTQCKAWYTKRGYSGVADLSGTLPTGDEVNIWNFAATQGVMKAGISNPDGDPKRFTKDGAGYYINGRDNVFTGCMSQETGGHGWVVNGSCNVLTGCFGESPSFYDCVKNQAKVNEAAGFLFTNWCWGVQATGCISKNAYKTHRDARLGFFVQNWTSKLTLRDCKAYDMPFVNGVDDKDGEIFVHVPKASSLSEQVYVDVNDFHFSNFTRDTTPGSSGPSSPAPAAAALIPSEIGGVVGHWDFSDTSRVTASAGRVSAVAPVAGTAPNGTMAQGEQLKMPWVSSLGGRSAIKVNRAASEFLQAPDIGTTPVSSGWSLAMVAAVNNPTDGQYLYSSIGGTSVSPASLTVNSKLALRPNSGGGSKGFTAKTADKALTQYLPAVIIMTVTSSAVEVWVNGVKSTEAPAVVGTTAGLVGKATIGSYYDGSSGADATIGEAALFAKTLSPAEIGGLNAYLASKWL